MYKYEENKYYNAGENAFHRWGKKAQEEVAKFLKPNDAGYYSFPVDGLKYWTIGTSNGRFGEFAKINDICFSVNKGGFMYAKEGTEKGEAFVKSLNSLIDAMKQKKAETTILED